MDDNQLLLAILFIPLLIIGLFEVCLLVYAYLNADTVKCNLLWCEFIQERTNISSRIESHQVIIKSITQECYKNGIQINCSDEP